MERTSAATVSDVFNPFHLTPAASLNQTLLADLPGANARWVGRPAFEALSLEALTKLAGRAGLGQNASSEDVVRSLSTALVAQHPTTAADAVRVVGTYGRRLAHLIATLKACGNRVAAASVWRAAYLRHWAQVDQVWLGGGLAAALGSNLLQAVRFEVGRLGTRDVIIELAPHAGVLALIGAARSRLRPRTHAVVLDFGHTAVKRGIATIKDDRLARLDLLRSLPAQTLETPGKRAGVVDFVLDVVTDTIEVGQRRLGALDPCILVSLASYLSRGRPVGTRSMYGPLRGVEPRLIDQELRERTGRAVHLRFLHDGTTAAQGLPDPHRAGLIVLGTALGVGFPPPSRTLLPVRPDLLIGDLDADIGEP